MVTAVIPLVTDVRKCFVIPCVTDDIPWSLCFIPLVTVLCINMIMHEFAPNEVDRRGSRVEAGYAFAGSQSVKSEMPMWTRGSLALKFGHAFVGSPKMEKDWYQTARTRAHVSLGSSWGFAVQTR